MTKSLLRIALLALHCCTRAALAAADDSAITVTPSYAPGDWVASTASFELRLDRPLTNDDGRLAILIGSTDWTALFERTEMGARYQPGPVPLPRGEQRIAVYLISREGEWREVAQVPLNVLNAAGFEKTTTLPAVSVSSRGQLATGRVPEVPPTDRDTFQDFTVNAGLQTTLLRNGWTTRMQSNVVGVSNQQEALRFGVEGAAAPRFDLADYNVGLESHRVALALGHASFGASRHLVNGFSSRGATARFKPAPAVDVAFAALNGSSVVGWSNFFGLDRREHQVLSGTVGIEMVPARPGGVRIAATVLDGSLLPSAGFNQAAINDAETSRGVSFNVSASDARQRVRLDAGYSRSRFENAGDPLLNQGLTLAAADATTRSARYLDASVAPVRGLNIAFRHERVEPLFRSVTAPVQADDEHNVLQDSPVIGAVTSQLSFGWTRDNLDALDSVLTTRTRTAVWSTSLPLGQFGGVEPRPWLPSVSYSLNRTHQFGDGLPVNADFDALSQVPDQVSLNQTIGAAWQAATWRASYQHNRSLQDNRQEGRQLADLFNFTNTASLGFSPPRSDVGVEIAWENAENREQAQVDITRRWSVNGQWQLTTRTTVSGSLTATWVRDEAETRDQRSTDLNLQFAQTVPFLPRTPDRLQAQLFVRAARQSMNALNLLFGVEPDEQRSWTVSTGLTFRVF